jgi:hypothetical protein
VDNDQEGEFPATLKLEARFDQKVFYSQLNARETNAIGSERANKTNKDTDNFLSR